MPPNSVWLLDMPFICGEMAILHFIPIIQAQGTKTAFLFLPFLALLCKVACKHPEAHPSYTFLIFTELGVQRREESETMNSEHHISTAYLEMCWNVVHIAGKAPSGYTRSIQQYSCMNDPCCNSWYLAVLM